MKARLKERLQDWVLLNYTTVLDRVTKEVCRDDVPFGKSRETAENAIQDFLFRLVHTRTSLSRRLVVGPDDGLRVQSAHGRRGRRRSRPFTVAYVVKCCRRRARALLVKEAETMTRIQQGWLYHHPLPVPDVTCGDERMGSGSDSAETVRLRENATERKLLLARLRRNLEKACEVMPENQKAALAVGVWKEIVKEGHTPRPGRSAFLRLIGCTQGDINRWRRETAEETQSTAPSHAKETLRRLLHEREISLRNLVKLAQVFRWYFFACS